ncbi:MAG: cache domain-containing protein [Treponemataceae bacterium]|nr:cache domain-containing protein [Treponemataceae bacterium]
MAEKKKVRRSSVVRFFVSGVALAMLAFSVMLLIALRIAVDQGLFAMSRDNVHKSGEVTIREINRVHEALKLCNEYLVDNVATYMRNRPETWAADLTDEAKKYFGADMAVIVNAEGVQVSPERNGKVYRPDIMKTALSGKSIDELVTLNEDIHCVYGSPIIIDGRVRGCVIVRKIASTDSLVQEIKEDTGYDVTIYATNGTLRAHTSVQGLKGTHMNDQKIADLVLGGGEIITNSIINDEEWISYYYPLKDRSGKVLTMLFMGTPYSDVRKTANRIFFTVLIICVIMSVILLVSTLLIFIKRIANPLKVVGDAIEHLGSGDADLTMQLPVHGNDEFAEICTNVNLFISMLHTIIRELTEVQNSIVELANELGSSSQQSASATAEILANVESIQRQSKTQTEAVTRTGEILNTAEQSTGTLNQLIENQSAATTESSAAIEQMLGNISSVSNSVHKMLDNFHELEQVVRSGNEKLSNVGGKVQQISEESATLMQANDMISQIASQTNLLAMNAAIEAAHAGDAGKGFSVVADEIRKLAENSSSQSSTISAQLKTITTSISDVVNLSGEAQTAFTNIVTHLGVTDGLLKEIDGAMSEQETASRQVFEGLTETKNMAVEVTEKSQDMSNAITNVSKEMNIVQEISDTISNSMDEMQAGAQQISESAQLVQDLATKTRDDLQIMGTQLGNSEYSKLAGCRRGLEKL